MLDKMLDPHAGLMIWTVISFLVLVGLMKALAWGPLLGVVEAREQALRDEREKAEKARQEAENIHKDLEARLANAQAAVKEIIQQANKDGDKVRAKLREDAEAESKAMLEKTRKQLEEDKNRLVGELRDEVASLSVMAAERLIKKSVDGGVKKSVLDGFFGDLEKAEKKN
jgi:F-type H+-transporting ATPase subunit b